MRKIFFSTALISIFTIGSLSAFSEEDRDEKKEVGAHRRCKEDELEKDKAIGRIDWAVKCSYVNPSFAAVLKAGNLYPSFMKGDATLNAPYDVDAPCDDAWTHSNTVFCMAGCYTPDQEILFDGEPLRIDAAAEAKIPTYTGLVKGSTVENLDFTEHEIKSYVSGATKEEVRKIETQDGHQITITKTHAMVKDDGSVIPASKIEAGTRLLTREGTVTTVASVKNELYEGKVYNILPHSNDYTENVLVAQGLLTGSVRYQNEWVNTNFRLQMRADRKLNTL